MVQELITGSGIERQLKKILADLQAEEKRLKKFYYIGGAAGFAIGFTVSYLYEPPEALGQFLQPLGVGAFAAFMAGLVGYMLACLPAEARARKQFLETFTTKEVKDHAEGALLRIVQIGSGIETLGRLRKKLGVVARQFSCRECGSRVEVDGPVARCKSCGKAHRLPVKPICPMCGKRQKVRVVSPEEQVAPVRTGEGKAGGAMMAGPVGFFAGGILDAIYLPFKQGWRSLMVATKGHMFRCDDCTFQWALKLPLPEYGHPLSEAREPDGK